MCAITQCVFSEIKDCILTRKLQDKNTRININNRNRKDTQLQFQTVMTIEGHSSHGKYDQKECLIVQDITLPRT